MSSAATSELSTFGLRDHARDRPIHVALWIGQITLAVAFLFAGVAKLAFTVAELAALVPWATAVHELVIRVAGAAELAGALGLVVPPLVGIRPGLAALAALGLAIEMAIAIGFHLHRGDAASAIVLPAVIAVIAAAIAIGRWRVSPIAPRRPPPLPPLPDM